MKTEKPIRFVQSAFDFPLKVELGRKAPDFGLSRWGAVGAVPALRFKPPENEGYAMRGDRRHLLYKGRRQSHRFTILHDGAFEYDCILKKEPESNVIALGMDGAEHYDFLRQPDFVPDPFLKGSYAVYKKETCVGEGTGKLCHIHKPKIIDAQGRWCWGELSIKNNCLLITIPETWLAGASYPVVVDPTVGTTTIGSQTTWYDSENNETKPLSIDDGIIVNRYLLPEPCKWSVRLKTWVYAYSPNYRGWPLPVLYTDNNNVPEYFVPDDRDYFYPVVNSSYPAGWRDSYIALFDDLVTGAYYWYGIQADTFPVRFDYGAKCYWDYVYDAEDRYDEFPLYSPSYYFNFKVSMYYTYTPAQDWEFRIANGVTLTDNRKTAFRYVKKILQTAQSFTSVKTTSAFLRKCLNTVQAAGLVTPIKILTAKIIEQVKAAMALRPARSVFRSVAATAGALGAALRKWDGKRNVNDTGNVSADIHKSLFMRVVLAAFAAVSDRVGRVMSFLRNIAEGVALSGMAVAARSLARKLAAG